MKLRFLERVALSVLRLNLATLRYRFHGEERLADVHSAGKRAILAVWHNQLAPSAYAVKNRGIVTMVSQSSDGAHATMFMESLGFDCTRGSSSRGGAGAVIAMKRKMDQGTDAALTVDGPKGPIYSVKPGIIYLAKKTGNPIVPMMSHASRKWVFNSWDRFELPKPFARVDVHFGDPIYLSKSTDKQLVERDIEFVQKRMKDFHEHTLARPV